MWCLFAMRGNQKRGGVKSIFFKFAARTARISKFTLTEIYVHIVSDQSSKSLNDGNRLVIRSYTINHRRPGAYPNDELMQPASPVLNTIDASVSRVRRQVAPYDDRQEMTTEVQSLEESTRMSRVFRIWDYYFSRFRQRQVKLI